MVDVVSRAEWGARDWVGRDPFWVAPTERSEFFVHYHGAPPPKQYGMWVPKNVEQIHVVDRGWSGTGYNFMVDMNGIAYEGRGWNLVGAHSPNHNRQGIGVYLAIGGDQTATPAALRTVRKLYDEGCARSGRNLAKRGHRDARATECPGDRTYEWVRRGMIVDLMEGAAPIAIGDGATIDRPVLYKGMVGRQVMHLQQVLRAAGHIGLAIDGDFGKLTETAVKNFQSEHGLLPDGVVGPATWAKLIAKTPAPRPGTIPAPTTPEEDEYVKTMIVKNPDSNSQYLVSPLTLTRKHIKTMADVRKYEAQGIPRETLTAAELASYPLVQS